jgi:hypothetical protein
MTVDESLLEKARADYLLDKYESGFLIGIAKRQKFIKICGTKAMYSINVNSIRLNRPTKCNLPLSVRMMYFRCEK